MMLSSLTVVGNALRLYGAAEDGSRNPDAGRRKSAAGSPAPEAGIRT
jgi:hypothetical protein